jgi:hypothetical protein
VYRHDNVKVAIEAGRRGQSSHDMQAEMFREYAGKHDPRRFVQTVEQAVLAEKNWADILGVARIPHRPKRTGDRFA